MIDDLEFNFCIDLKITLSALVSGWHSLSNFCRFLSPVCTKCQESVGEKISSEKSDLKLFIVSCIFASVRDFAELVHFILVLDHALLHSYPHH